MHLYSRVNYIIIIMTITRRKTSSATLLIRAEDSVPGRVPCRFQARWAQKFVQLVVPADLSPRSRGAFGLCSAYAAATPCLLELLRLPRRLLLLCRGRLRTMNHEAP